MSHYSNHTENMAIGAVDKELRLMRIKARHIKALKEKGNLTPEDLEIARKQFIGIYHQLLVEALSDKPKRKRLPADAGSLFAYSVFHCYA